MTRRLSTRPEVTYEVVFRFSASDPALAQTHIKEVVTCSDGYFENELVSARAVAGWDTDS